MTVSLEPKTKKSDNVQDERKMCSTSKPQRTKQTSPLSRVCPGSCQNVCESTTTVSFSRSSSKCGYLVEADVSDVAAVLRGGGGARRRDVAQPAPQHVPRLHQLLPHSCRTEGRVQRRPEGKPTLWRKVCR